LDPEVRQALEEVRGASGRFNNKNGDSQNNRSIHSLPEIVAHEAQNRLEDMEHRQWALPIGIAGKMIDIRTLLGNFLMFAKVVKEKGDAFIGLDPTGYAKLAWLPFSLFVDVCTHPICDPWSFCHNLESHLEVKILLTPS
jgi:hypothetical protein